MDMWVFVMTLTFGEFGGGGTAEVRLAASTPQLCQTLAEEVTRYRGGKRKDAPACVKETRKHSSRTPGDARR